MQTKTLALFFAFIGGASAICNSPGDSRLAGPLRSRPFGHLVQPSLRGGGASQPPKRVKQSYTQQAVDFFGSERIPASFLAGTSLSLLFAFPLADDDAPHLQVRPFQRTVRMSTVARSGIFTYPCLLNTPRDATLRVATHSSSAPTGVKKDVSFFRCHGLLQ
jgi:hypothetical protein